MAAKVPPNGLNAILYFLNYITDLTVEPILPDSLIGQIKDTYKPEMVQMMCEALEWSLQNQDFDFASQIQVNYKNHDILLYLDKVHHLFEKEGIYGL